jgi:hypothetical protein
VTKQLTLCDICGAEGAKQITLTVDFVFDGVETVNDNVHYDLCLTHAIEFLERSCTSHEEARNMSVLIERRKKVFK